MKRKQFDKVLVSKLITILKERTFATRITRKDLLQNLRWACGWPVSDRDMRAAIEFARSTREGALICSTTASGGGYWTALTRLELDRYLSQDESRCLEMWRRIRSQRLAAGILLHDESLEQMEML